MRDCARPTTTARTCKTDTPLSLRRLSLLALAATVLTACSEREIVLPGARETLREDISLVQSDAPVRSAALPPQTRNAAWPQSHATPATRTDHASLNSMVAEIWSAGIGQGDKRRARITADPVAADGRIFTMDSAAVVTATSTAGETLWQADLTPEADSASDTTGGALAYGDGRLYVTSALGEVTALDPATGTTLWSQVLGNTGTGTPSYAGGLVYLVSGDTTAWALEADTGRVRWQLDGLADAHNVMGGPAPVVTPQRVIFAYGSGDLQAAFRQGGLRLWSTPLAGARSGLAVSLVDDVTGDPVARGDTLYAGNFSGSFVALELANGERRWTVPTGALGPAWVTDDSVYIVSDLSQLVRLDAATGAQVWAVDLPGYVERRRPQRRRDNAYANHGPVLAGGQLWVASSDGSLRAFDPTDGALTQTVPLRGGATTAPIVVDGTLYVVSTKGTLHAFR